MYPTVRKWMPIALDIGEFKNGEDSGTLDAAVIQEMLKNYAFNAKVPIYLWSHVENLDDAIPDGWVEGLKIDAQGRLMGDVKVMGEAARLLIGDRIRGLSPAWRVDAKDYSGESIGAMLMHVTLTNQGYLKTLPNIAAARAKGGEPLSHCFIALPSEEVGMSDPKDKKEPSQADKDRVDPTQDEPTVAALKEKDTLIISLKAQLLTAGETIEELKEKIDAKPVDTDKEEQSVRLKQAEYKLDALEIRELVAKGMNTGTLKPSWCSGYNEGGYNGTMTWFKASKFSGDKKLLAWAVENNPVMYKTGKTFKTGAPIETGEKFMSSEERETVRKLGLNPEAVLAGMKGNTREEVMAAMPHKES